MDKFINKNINKIIFNYIDYSLKNLSSKLNKVRIVTTLTIIDGISIEDIMVLCIRRGYHTFYVNNIYDCIITKLKKLKQNDNIRRFEYNECICYNMILDVKCLYACDLLSFPEILKYEMYYKYE